MKCVILTFHNVYNYGAVLQAYSLKRFVEKRGSTVYFADARNIRIQEPYRLNPIHRPFGVRATFERTKALFCGKVSQAAAFSRFISTQMGTTVKADRRTFKELSPDVVIIGSDQVWNDTLTGETDANYLPWLDKSVTKIAYAASFGKKELSYYQKKCISTYIDGFDSVSLREQAGLAEIQQLSSAKAEIVLDPVFLNSAAFWSAAAERSRIHFEKDSYILFYSLSGRQELARTAQRLSKKLGKKVIAIHPTGVKQRLACTQLYNVGPFEFIELIKNASLTVTDSFHGTAFSLLLGKRYCNAQSSTDARIGSLLERIGAYSSCTRQLAGTQILDFSLADKQRLSQLADASKAFLDKAMHKSTQN